MIKQASYLDFFPYPTFRPEQERLIGEIERAVRLKKNVLLVGPNGVGKTIIVLSALLPTAYERKLKIVYMCRTHSQSARVIQELKKIYEYNPRSGYDNSGLSIRGRNEMCLNETLKKTKISPTEAMSKCKSLRVSKSCVYYTNVKNSTDGFKDLDLFYFKKPVEAEELIELCEKKLYCPYFLSKSLLKNMPVVVCNFQWLFNPDIRFRFLKLLGTTLDKCILVVDEAHNIIDVATDVNSMKLSPNFLSTCMNTLQQSGVNEKYVQFVRFLRNKLNQRKKDLSSGEKKINTEKLLLGIYRRLRLKNSEEFESFLNSLGEVYRHVDMEQENLSKFKTNIKYLVKFWQKWSENYNSEKFFFCYSVKKSNNRKFINLEIVALDPRDITLSLFRHNYACVNLSGTINANVFKHLTGLTWKKGGYKEITARSPFKSKNILALITEGVDTARDNRNSEMYEKIIAKIKEVIISTPANIGIFCGSYKILGGLRTNGIMEMVKSCKKRLFIEHPSNTGRQNAKLLEDFKGMSNSPKKGAVLLGVCGGRNSEGEDYPGNFMNAVIVVGIPYHLQTPRVKAKMKYYDKEFNNQGWVFAYLYPAMQRANQASGRPIRRESDKGVIIFMDSRFKKQLGWISPWIRREIKTCPDINNILSSALAKFWNK